jgi:hypothetical protein
MLNTTVTGGTQPYTYTWSSGQSVKDLSNLVPGMYWLSVTDAHDCHAYTNPTITQPDLLAITGASVNNVSCYGYTNGYINITVAGGTTPYTFTWNNGATTQNISGLTGGTYWLTVTDAHLCGTGGSYSITTPDPWNVHIHDYLTQACCSPGNLSYYSAYTDGTAPVCPWPHNFSPTFEWVVIGGTIKSGQNTDEITVEWSCCGSGIVKVVATACNGCTRETSVTIIIHQPPAPVITGPATVTANQTGTTYCTPYFANHLYTWTVIGGTVTAGDGTNCITVTWGPYPPCGCGTVTVCETDTTGTGLPPGGNNTLGIYEGCTGCTTMNITILPANPKLSGYVKYKNAPLFDDETALNNVTINLRDLSTGTIVGTTTSGPNLLDAGQPGFYAFTNVNPGTYALDCSYDGAWGGNNATDALLVQLNVLHAFDALNWVVADVNGSLSITALDALYIKLRVVGMINSYPAGDWKFALIPFTVPYTSQNVLVGTTHVDQNIHGLCVGDVNGSYYPTGMKDISFLSTIEDEIQNIQVNESFTYNIRSNTVADLGAMTLFMNYDQNRFEIEKVNSSSDEMKYKIGDGKLALAWSDTKPLSVKNNETVLSLQMKAKVAIDQPTSVFNILPGSEFADILANRYDDFSLKMSKVITPDETMGFSIFNYPNPFRNTTDIVYVLPESGTVTLILTDMYGKMVRTLVEAVQQDAGQYTFRVDPNEYNLSPGVYLYKIVFVGNTNTHVKVNKMILTN